MALGNGMCLLVATHENKWTPRGLNRKQEDFRLEEAGGQGMKLQASGGYGWGWRRQGSSGVAARCSLSHLRPASIPRLHPARSFDRFQPMGLRLQMDLLAGLPK